MFYQKKNIAHRNKNQHNKIFIPKAPNPPKFSIGDLVGLRQTIFDETYELLKTEYVKKGWMYTVQRQESHKRKNIFFEKEIYLKPLIRTVLFEKFNLIKENQRVIDSVLKQSYTIWSGESTYKHYNISYSTKKNDRIAPVVMF